MNIFRRVVIPSSFRKTSSFPRIFYHQTKELEYCLLNRKFSSSQTSICWSCGNHSGKAIFCPKCNALQKVDKQKDYFEMLNLPRNYNVDSNTLTQAFREMQSVFHPDKFSSKSQEEQNISLEWSSLINNAYKTLLAPIKRGEYILQQNGIVLPQDNSELDQKFLIEMLERNEEVDEANTEVDLRKLLVKIRKELSATSEELARAFEENNLKSAVAIIVKMKYFISLEGSIKEKKRRLGYVD